jgi:predicted ArsR family transcriptional regulator
LLEALKRFGPQTAGALGAILGISGEAARQQLQKLLDAGLVRAESTPQGVGRPALLWHLTPAGSASFADGHAELAAQIVRSLRLVLGPDSLDAVLAQRSLEIRTKYEDALSACLTLEDRGAMLASLRTREGYMAEWRAEGDSFLLIEHHCPVCAVASQCPGLCRDELVIFRALLGHLAEVNRDELITAGGRRCVYRVTPRPVHS